MIPYIAVLIGNFLLKVSQEIVEFLGVLRLRYQPKFIVLIIDYSYLKTAEMRVMMDVLEYVVCIEVGSINVSSLIDPYYFGDFGELL